jgi:acyl-CoA synthetase (AMP-forming)/AMP-acid ligase II
VLPDSITGAAQRFGDRPALIDATGASLTYADLDRWSDELAVSLANRHGVREGTVAALLLPSDPRYVASYLALAKLGAVTAGVNPRMAPDEQQRILDQLSPDLVIGDDFALERVTNETPPSLTPEVDRITTIVFTSGTTGEPKGAVFTDRQLTAVTTIDVGGLETWGSGAAMLASTQFCHIGFMTKLPWYLRLGCTLVLQDRWRAPDTLRLVGEHHIPSIGGVAAQIALLLRVPDFDTYDVSSVATIVIGGGPSPPEIVREARERFGADYSIRYSSTESGGVGTATAFDAPDEEALHTVGRPRPGVDLRIDENTDELLLRSPAVMTGYWRDPERTAATLVGGWLHTGDLAEMDGNGCVRIVGRTTDMYIRGGYNVHPQEVEAVLVEHPSVSAIAVVPRSHEVFGEIGVAVVVPSATEPAPTLEELRTFGAARLASYKLPESLVVTDSLPLTTMDKLDRRGLRHSIAGVGAARRGPALAETASEASARSKNQREPT